MSKYLVTGASGFIGTALIEELCNNGEEIIAVVRNENSNINTFSNLANIKIVYCDMEYIETLETKVKDRDIDACIHLAWNGSTGEARADYERQLKNVIYSINLVNVLSKMNIKRMVGAGSLAELDVLNYHGVDKSRPNAVSHYGTAKLTTHYMTKAECVKLKIEHIWCYLSNTYGEGNRTNNFVNFASLLMLEGKRAAFTNGEQMYDFVYVKDTARALYAALKYGKDCTAYYLGSTRQRKLKEYIKIIRDTINPEIELHLGEITFNGIALSEAAFDSSKLVQDTGYCPQYLFEETIGPTVTWIKENIYDSKI